MASLPTRHYPRLKFVPDGVRLNGHQNMPKKQLPKEIREYFKRKGAQGGKIGGRKRMDALTKKERAALARKAAAARWKDKPKAD